MKNPENFVRTASFQTDDFRNSNSNRWKRPARQLLNAHCPHSSTNDSAPHFIICPFYVRRVLLVRFFFFTNRRLPCVHAFTRATGVPCSYRHVVFPDVYCIQCPTEHKSADCRKFHSVLGWAGVNGWVWPLASRSGRNSLFTSVIIRREHTNTLLRCELIRKKFTW